MIRRADAGIREYPQGLRTIGSTRSIHVLANQPHGWISKAAPLPYFGAAVVKTVGRYQSLKMCCSCWIRHQGVNWEPVLVLAGGCVKIGPCAVTFIHSDCVLGVNALHILCLSLPLH